jgi:hypothetical protein
MLNALFRVTEASVKTGAYASSNDDATAELPIGGGIGASIAVLPSSPEHNGVAGLGQ